MDAITDNPILADAFDAFANAPNGIPKLRELILDLAVRGKLVPQNPDDEPASELLKRIAAEKARLAKEKKIRKPKELPKSETTGFPAGWSPVRLYELGEFCSGSTPSKNRGDFWGGRVPWISPKDMKSDSIQGCELFISDQALEETRIRLLPRETVLVVTRSGILKRLLPVAVTRIECCINQDIKALIPFDRRTAAYIRLMLKGHEHMILHDLVKGGVTVQSVVFEDFASFPFPLPPLAEQKRIVAKVDALMALCDELEAKQTARQTVHVNLRKAALTVRDTRDPEHTSDSPDILDSAFGIRHFNTLITTPESVTTLRQTILDLAVRGKLVPQDPNDEPASELLKRIAAEKARLITEKIIRKPKALLAVNSDELLFPIPPGWLCQRFADVVLLQSGVTKGRRLAGREAVELPYLRVANVQRGFLDLTVIKEIPIKASETSKYALERGDLLMTEGGDWDKLGRTAIWRGDIPVCVHQNHVFRARPVGRTIVPEWGQHVMNSLVGRSYFASASKQTTNLASINMTQLSHFPFPLPPLAEQQRIVAKVDALMALCDQLEAKLRSSQALSADLATATVAHVGEMT